MILITRHKEQSKNLESLLNTQEHKTFVESLYKIQFNKNKVTYNSDNYYIFPSINSVYSLIDSRQIYKFRTANILTIGKKVEQALRNAGCNKILFVASDSTKLLTRIKNKKLINRSFIYFCSNVVNEDFLSSVDKYKIKLKKVIIYKTIPRQKLTKKLITNIKLKNISGATFFSKLAAKTFLSLIAESKCSRFVKETHIYCISDRVASVFKLKKFNHIYIASKPSQNSLIKLINKNQYFK
tara:strand:- start:55 stop:774 length:720 start_codon:yes stop_codon:yes gene_type:complete